MYTEIKYLNLLSTRLQRFKQTKRNLWNFRCPICGDSQRNKLKARGFVFEVKGSLMYKCHNCGVSMLFPRLLDKVDPQLYKEYTFEKLKDSNKPRMPTAKLKKIVSSKPVFKKTILGSLTPIGNLNNSHPAKEYLLNRQLPIEALYFTEKFKEWTNSVKPNTFQDITQDEPRIIIPFIDKEGVVFGFQGRSLSNTGLRYITILLDEERPKIFGLNTLDESRRIYITEGPFDSLLVDNGLAMAGADIDISSTLGGNHDVVFVLDNEPRNKEITNRIERHISQGHQVVIWPSDIKQKDINDMLLAGIAVEKLIECNVYSGLTAKLKFNNWCK
jgi:transcription elongation factor Elf1